MWKHSEWSKPVKIGITILCLLAPIVDYFAPTQIERYREDFASENCSGQYHQLWRSKGYQAAKQIGALMLVKKVPHYLNKNKVTWETTRDAYNITSGREFTSYLGKEFIDFNGSEIIGFNGFPENSEYWDCWHQGWYEGLYEVK